MQAKGNQHTRKEIQTSKQVLKWFLESRLYFIIAISYLSNLVALTEFEELYLTLEVRVCVFSAWRICVPLLNELGLVASLGGNGDFLSFDDFANGLFAAFILSYKVRYTKLWLILALWLTLLKKLLSFTHKNMGNMLSTFRSIPACILNEHVEKIIDVLSRSLVDCRARSWSDEICPVLEIYLKFDSLKTMKNSAKLCSIIVIELNLYIKSNSK